MVEEEKYISLFKICTVPSSAAPIALSCLKATSLIIRATGDKNIAKLKSNSNKHFNFDWRMCF